MPTPEALLAQARAAGLYRERRAHAGPMGREIMLDGRACLCFCSNDYLGLAGHAELARALAAGAAQYGVGSGAAQLVCGHTHAHRALEEELAAFVGRPRALLFASGYLANLGALSALLARQDTVYQDRLDHASLIDAARLSGARLRRYPHRDTAMLARWLDEPAAGMRFIATDAVFSMDGDLAPLPELAALAQRADAWLMVDDAHGFGVLGAQGQGSLAHFGLDLCDAPILMATLGKALGCSGAFVAGDMELIEALVQTARSYVYTTAPPPALAEAARAALRIVQREPERRARLHAVIARFRAGAAQLGLAVPDSATPIQSLRCGSPEAALSASARLLESGIFVAAIRPPTVPAGTARLRIGLSAAHRDDDVDRLLEALVEASSGR